MPIEYIAAKDSSGKLHINTVDTSGKVALAHNVQQFPTLAAVAAAFPDAVGEPELLFEPVEPAPWSPGGDYKVNDIVKHDGRVWVALPDVANGYPPDDVYAEDGSSGGWMPF